ncbi:hypothetical protein LTR53_010082 [Teratosphaeriaceae sp. CCFEE 6253]|nr:hypothetical protein LTR53_010082 [Teratosphaeriaceae sp. CCFEE 6253]
MYRTKTFTAAALLAVSINQVTSLAIPGTAVSLRSTYPFDRLVAFGDELSDNGNGSYAHGITGDNSNNYGFGTWTDGPVAVSYLADLLHAPLTDYAFGGCCGGASSGATINNTYSAAAAQYDGKPVPSVHDQIFWNYTKAGVPSGIGSALQFIWTGVNDLGAQTNPFWAGDPKNALFASNISDRIRYNAEHLIKLGAPYVFVANIYPKERAPVTSTYYCPDGTCIDGMGKVIQAANSAIESELKGSKYASKLIYYDVYGFMVDLMENKDSYGLTQPLSYYCDGDAAVAKWDECAAGSYTWEGAQQFFWMNFVQPTTRVHQLIAADMKKRVDEVLGV